MKRPVGGLVHRVVLVPRIQLEWSIIDSYRILRPGPHGAWALSSYFTTRVPS
jgi:hypothetical protein